MQDIEVYVQRSDIFTKTVSPDFIVIGFLDLIVFY